MGVNTMNIRCVQQKNSPCSAKYNNNNNNNVNTVFSVTCI